MKDLPAALLRNILSFVGNTKDFRSCEKTSQALKDVLADDNVWALCKETKPDDYDRAYLNKELALIPSGIKKIRKWQKATNSIILSDLEVPGWKRLVLEILTLLPPDVLEDGSAFDLRGDTSAVQLEIVEYSAMIQLKRSNFIAARLQEEFLESKEFQTVKVKDIRLQNGLLSAELIMQKCFPSVASVNNWDAHLEQPGGAFLGVDRDTRDNLVCRLAWRAGIVKMEYGVYKLVWALLVKTILEVMTPALDTATKEFDPRLFHKSYLNPNAMPTLPKRVVSTSKSADKTIRTIPPLPLLSGSIYRPHCRKIPLVYTIGPKQVEDSAKLLGLGKVYGGGWQVDEDDANPDGLSQEDLAEKVKLAAMFHYSFLDNDETEEPLPSFPLVKHEKTVPWIIPDGDTDNDDEEYEPYVYEQEDESEDLGDDYLVDGVDEAVRIVYPEVLDCAHPNGFVLMSTVPNIIL